MKQIKKRKNQIVILSIIGVIILMSMFFLRVNKVQEINSNDLVRKQDIKNISEAMEIYFKDFQHYPYSSEGLIIGCGESASQMCEWGGVWENSSDKKVYMDKLPLDPDGNHYYYVSDPQGKTFSVFAFLENEKDDEVKKDEGQPAFYKDTFCRVIDGVLSADTCNYVVTGAEIEL